MAVTDLFGHMTYYCTEMANMLANRCIFTQQAIRSNTHSISCVQRWFDLLSLLRETSGTSMLNAPLCTQLVTHVSPINLGLVLLGDLK